ncbi:MAG TPA: hypothetical protein VGT44_09805 [Ktedonobacteraceae bacterium]|nr:hypothetical protein [Ktedonobacteraceae bacterium]
MITRINPRLKLFLTGFLLCIALGVAIFCAIQTYQAFQRFQQSRNLTLSGDVSTIRPWMTIPYIARVYHVPASYLDEQLRISNPQDQSRASLHTLATRYNRPLDRVIHDVQQAILNYRKQHPTHTLHPPGLPHPAITPKTTPTISRRMPG